MSHAHAAAPDRIPHEVYGLAAVGEARRAIRDLKTEVTLVGARYRACAEAA